MGKIEDNRRVMAALEKDTLQSAVEQNPASHEGENKVSQPAAIKMREDLNRDLGAFIEEVNKVSETSKGGPGEQWSGSGTSNGSASQAGGSTRSARDEAIARIPSPAVMQKKLEKHIQQEVKELRKQAKTIARISKPGSAYKLNQLYARIRLLNALLAEVLEASAAALKRLFVKVFIDKQTIL